jgi:hypothetical protein
MILSAAWPQVLDFCGTPLVIEPSPGQVSGDAGLLAVRQFDQRIGLTRAFAEAVDGPCVTGLAEHSLSERAPARVVGSLAGCQDRDGHGNRLDSGAAQRSGPGGKEQECRTSRASVGHTNVASLTNAGIKQQVASTPTKAPRPRTPPPRRVAPTPRRVRRGTPPFNENILQARYALVPLRSIPRQFGDAARLH